MSRCDLFDLVLPDNERHLVLKEVYLNDKSTLKKIKIASNCDREIVVKLRAEVGSKFIAGAVKFQLDNENLRAMERSGSSVVTSENINELFNIIDHIKEVTLQPRESKDLIVLFQVISGFIFK